MNFYQYFHNKQSIYFLTSKLLCAISIQSLMPLYSISLKLGITHQYFDQYLCPIDYSFLQVFWPTKLNISFITSKLLCAICLKSLYPLYPISLKLAIIYLYFNQNIIPINNSF